MSRLHGRIRSVMVISFQAISPSGGYMLVGDKLALLFLPWVVHLPCIHLILSAMICSGQIRRGDEVAIHRVVVGSTFLPVRPICSSHCRLLLCFAGPARESIITQTPNIAIPTHAPSPASLHRLCVKVAA